MDAEFKDLFDRKSVQKNQEQQMVYERALTITIIQRRT